MASYGLRVGEKYDWDELRITQSAIHPKFFVLLIMMGRAGVLRTSYCVRVPFLRSTQYEVHLR